MIIGYEKKSFFRVMPLYVFILVSTVDEIIRLLRSTRDNSIAIYSRDVVLCRVDT